MGKFQFLQTASKSELATVMCVGLACCYSTLHMTSAIAQDVQKSQKDVPSPQEMRQWEQLKQTDARIQACAAVWKRTLVIKPKPKLNIEKTVARAVERAQQNGQSADEVKEEARITRALAQKDTRGDKVSSVLSFVRVGGTVRCEIVDNASSDKATKSLNFYDGKNSLFLPLQVDGEEVPRNAILLRDNREVLSYCAAGWLLPQLLTGFPLLQDFSPGTPTFSPTDSQLRSGEGDTLILEKKTPPHFDGLSQYPALHRVTLSSKTLRPVLYQPVNLLYDTEDQGTKGRVRIEDYRQYADGIWFPSQVTITTPAFTMNYKLVSAAFNEAVDPLRLRLPAEVTVADSRFGLDKKPAIYKLKNGALPTDDEVRQKLGLNKEAAAAKDNAVKATDTAQPEPPTSPVAPAAGLLFMALGGMMWVRSRKDEPS